MIHWILVVLQNNKLIAICIETLCALCELLHFPTELCIWLSPAVLGTNYCAWLWNFFINIYPAFCFVLFCCSLIYFVNKCWWYFSNVALLAIVFLTTVWAKQCLSTVSGKLCKSKRAHKILPFLGVLQLLEDSLNFDISSSYQWGGFTP